jgi:arylformamidase
MSVMSQEPLWRGMTRSQLDAAYNNSVAVANSAEKIADWRDRSASFRAQHSQSLDLRYGDRPRNRIDVFPCGRAGAPLFVFFHGGYWQRNEKGMFSRMGEGPVVAGFDVALPGYTLAPDASLTEIVAEARDAVCWLRREHPNGVAGARLIVGGWSAGGHLTAMTMDLPEVDAGLSISDRLWNGRTSGAATAVTGLLARTRQGWVAAYVTAAGRPRPLFHSGRAGEAQRRTPCSFGGASLALTCKREVAHRS